MEKDEDFHIAFKIDKGDTQQLNTINDDKIKTVRMTEFVRKDSPLCKKSPETLFANVPAGKQADENSEGRVRDDAYEELRKTHKGNILTGGTNFPDFQVRCPPGLGILFVPRWQMSKVNC